MIEDAYITAKNLFRMIVLRVFQYPLMIVFVLTIPKMMGPDAYGKYAFFASILVILGVITQFGTIETLGRYIILLNQDKSAINRLVLNVIFLRTFTIILIGISLISIFFLFFTFEDVKFYIIILIAALIYVIEGTLYNLLYGLNDISKFATRDLFRRFFNLLFIIVMFHFFNLYGAILAILVSEIALLIFAINWTKKYLNLKKFKFDIVILKPYIKFAFPFYISFIIVSFLHYLGNPLIQFISKNTSEVAVYDVANQAFLTFWMFINYIFSAMIPVFTTLLAKKNENKIIKWSSLMLKYTGIAGIILFGSILLIGNNITTLIFGIEYQKVFTNVVILFFGLFVNLISQIGMVYSIIYKEAKNYFIANVVSLIIYLLASLILIPHYASIGASIAATLSSLILGIILYFKFNSFYSKIIKPFIEVTLIGFVLILLFYYYRFNFLKDFEWLLLCLSFYLTLLFTLKYVNIFDIKELLTAIKGKKLKD